ncbi:MAG: PhoH family protein [Cytophagales bacterium]|nr:PhoH family protein [Cytophagales bacterium]MDW8383239.1 PhoH family protein [Flammeovirgaceae bacterium]
MVEKVIILENISLLEFLGAENENIKHLAAAFPKSKLISRGNQITIQGNGSEIIRINDVISLLVSHYHKFGKITKENIDEYLHKEKEQSTVFVPTEKEEDIILYGTKGFGIRPKTENQIKLVEAVKKNDLVFALGPAGTGKTYVSVALAVKALKMKQVKKIVITRPAVEAGEHLGFLPGDMKEKIDPYLKPIYDALDDMIPSEKLKYYFEERIIEVAPLAFMRGRTLHNAYVLLDEAQNTTPMQMKMFLTRMGPESKTIVTGDISQIDLPKNQKSGLVEAVRILKDIPGIEIVELSGKDVMRHRLVKSIIAAYDKYEAQTHAPKVLND